MTTINDKNYIQEGLPLLYLFWYSVGVKDIAHETLEGYFKQTQIELKYLPRKIRTVDAFRKATKTAERKIEVQKGKFIIYTVEEVQANSTLIERKLYRSDKSTKNAPLHVEATFILNKSLNNMICSETEDPTTSKIVKDVIASFEQYRTSYNAQNIRKIFKNIINDMSPVAAKQTGAMYFIPSVYYSRLVNFSNLIGLLNNDDEGSDASILPIGRCESAIEVVTKATINQLKEIQISLDKAFAANELSSADIIAVTEQSQLYLDIVSDYRSTLGDELAWFINNLSSTKQKIENVSSRKQSRTFKNNI